MVTKQSEIRTRFTPDVRLWRPHEPEADASAKSLAALGGSPTTSLRPRRPLLSLMAQVERRLHLRRLHGWPPLPRKSGLTPLQSPSRLASQ